MYSMGDLTTWLKGSWQALAATAFILAYIWTAHGWITAATLGIAFFFGWVLGRYGGDRDGVNNG